MTELDKLNKLNKVLQHYLNLLDLRNKRLKNKKTAIGNTMTRRGFSSRRRIIAFFVKNGEWPSKNSPYNNDKKLGVLFVNYISPSCASYDPILRKIALATGHKAHNKRPHNSALHKITILEFIRLTGHAPGTHSRQKIQGEYEGSLREKLDYYTKKDMGFLGKVYALDKCHRSGIPMRFRHLINESLEIDKPLIRLVKE